MRKKNTNEQLHTQPQFRLKPVYAAVLLAFTVQTVQANPTDATVVSGQASFATAGNTLTVTNTPGAIIHWQGFSIGANEITRFAQQSASSAVLNRVVSNNPSSILGTLQSNGRVFLINPNGIVFGAGSTVDVAGLVASTLNLSNADFLAGRYSFTEVPGAQNISNAGNISSRDGGQIYLIAPDVENTGVITAPNGEILLAAGHSVDLVNTNSPNLIVNITAPAGDATNVGKLIAESGSLGLFGTVVRNSGVVSADSATLQGGKIVFRSSQRTEAGGTVSAQGVGGGEIKMLSDMQTGTVSVTGTLNSSAPVSGDGGYIDTSAAHVQVTDTARVTTAAANGTSGDWLIDPTDFVIAATDPGGVSYMSNTTLSTSLGSGNVTIQTLATGAGNGDIFVNDAVTWSANLLTLNAHRNINVNANLNGSGAASLALEYGQGALAAGNTSGYKLAPGVQISLPAGNNFSTKLGSDGGTVGYYVITSLGAELSTTGTDLQGINGNLSGNYALGSNIDALPTSGWGVGFDPIGDGITSFSGLFDGLGHTVSDLRVNGGGDAGLFGMVDLSGVVRNVGLVNSIVMATGSTVGGLVGNNAGTISNSYVSNGSVSATGAGVSPDLGGLVGVNSGTISNSYVSGGTVVGDYSGVGGLVGNNSGTISNSYVSGGSVVSTGSFPTGVGGLVGINNNAGSIINSYVIGTSVNGFSDVGGLVGNNSGSVLNTHVGAGSVGFASTSGSSGNYFGGLVGSNSGVISNSYVSGGTVGVGTTSTFLNNVGGLVGRNSGTISNTYVTGGTVTGYTDVAGLVGWNELAGLISTSYAASGLVADCCSSARGLVALNEGTLQNSVWDTGTTGALSGWSGTGTGTAVASLATADFMTQANFTSPTAANGFVNPGFDFTTGSGTWFMIDGNTRPFLQSEYSPTITNSHQLQLMAMNLGASYTLGANIDMAETASGTGMWGSAGFVPVGSFSGSLDGQGNTISNLFIDRPLTAGVGLFSWLNMGSAVSNVGLVGGSVNGWYRVGGLAGHSDGSISNTFVSGMAVSEAGASTLGGLVGKNGFYGSISNSYVDSGSVTGSGRWVGGLAGLNDGSIDNSHVINTTVAAVSGNSVGGLVGWNTSGALVSNSYVSNGGVSGNNYVGGLVGWNSGTVNGSNISNGSVTGSFDVGGLVGWNSGSIDNSSVGGISSNVTGSNGVGGLAGNNNGTISNSYVSSGLVWEFTGSSTHLGGLVGTNTGVLTNSHYDIDNVSINDSNLVTLGGLFGAQYLDWYGTGIIATGGLVLDIADYALTLSGSAGSYTISNVQGMKDLLGFADNAAYTFSLAADIDLLGYADLYIPYLAASFSGSDGTNFYTISNLNVNQSFNDNLGLFGHIATGSTVSNVALLNAVVMGNSMVGALAGWNEGAISNSHVSGATTTVSGLSNVGGLAGLNDNGSINSSDVIGGNVIGSSNIGGLAGQNYFGTIDGSHVSAVNVDGGTSGLNAGGLVGFNYLGVISNSHVDSVTVVTGGTRVGGLLGFDGGEGQGVFQSNTVTDTTVTGSNYVGGLVGYIDTGFGATGYVDDNHVVNSFVNGRAGSAYLGGLIGWNGAPISNSSVSGTEVSGGMSFVGGLVGYNTFVGSSSGTVPTIFWGGRISNSYVSGGSVSGNSSVGGLAGSNAGEISNSFVSGSAISGGTASSANYVGGLVGNNNGGILNSYASGGTVTGGNNVGGLVGNNGFPGAISFGYADVGSVAGRSNVGGVVGYNYQGTVGDTFWNTALAGGNLANGIGYDFLGNAPTDVGAAGLTSAQLKTLSSFTGWDIANTGGSAATWRIYDDYTGQGYTTPLLTSFLKPLVITAGFASKTYDGATYSGGLVSPAYTDGFITVVPNPLDILGTANAYGLNAINAGTYAPALYSDQLGYDISYVDGALAVNPYAVSMTGSRTYDGTANVAAGIFTLGPLVGTETLTLGGSGSVSSANVSAGSQTVTLGTLALGNGTGLASNYTFTGGTQTAAINPASLTVTANNASKTFDAVAYSGGNGVTYTGFVNSETSAVLAGALTYGGTSQGAVNAGSYVITPGGWTSSNYTIGYVDGTLTIDPAALTLLSVTASDASKTYGTALTFNGSEFTPVGLLGGDTISGVTLASAGAVDTANAGTYAITPSNAVFSVGSASNYTLSYVDGQLTVTARPINVTANAIGKVYGDADPALTYTVGGLGLTSWDTNATAFTGALARAAGENVAASPYDISQGTLTATNYTITFAGNVFSITPAPLSVFAFPANKIISQPDPLLTYMVSGLKLGDTAAATLNSGSLARDAGEAVGNYQINQGSLALASSNYTMSYFPASFTILAPTVVDEIANAILLLGTPETGSAQSTSSSEEEEKRKAEEAAAAAGTPASGETTTSPLPVCPGA